jgi:phospholipase D1/2
MSTGPAPPQAVAVELPEAEPDAPHTGRALLVLALAVGALLAVYLSPLHAALLPQGLAPLRRGLDAAGPLAPLLFGLGAAALVAMGAPRLWFAAAAGLLFGWFWGALLAQAATLLGCLLNFAWGRRLARDLRPRQRAPRLGRLLDAVARAPIATNVAVRLCPVGNCFAFNLLLAASTVSTRDFLVGTFLGTAPETLAFALFGGSAEEGSVRQALAGAGLMVALAVASFALARRWRRR